MNITESIEYKIEESSRIVKDINVFITEFRKIKFDVNDLHEKMTRSLFNTNFSYTELNNQNFYVHMDMFSNNCIRDLQEMLESYRMELREMRGE